MIDASLSLAVLMIGTVRDSDASGRYVLLCFFEEKRNWFEACREKKEGLHCVFEMTKHVNSSANEQCNLMDDVFFGFSSRTVNHSIWTILYPLSFTLFTWSRNHGNNCWICNSLACKSMIGLVRDSDAGKRYTLCFKLSRNVQNKKV